jgi:putative membrane protein insertion efficiency factor
MKNILKKIVILPIRFYRVAISPMIGPSCRYSPSCSKYAIEAIEEWGVIRGLWMGLRRISRCHPWGGHGYDPVPKREVKNKSSSK